MEAFDYYELVNTINRQRYREAYFNNLANFFESLTDSGILSEVKDTYKCFYPKYLWQEEKQLNIYFFTQTQIVECGYDLDGNINIETNFIKDIELLKINNLNAARHDIELEIYFINGTIYVFNSEDSNEYWKRRFFNNISEIYKFLITATAK